MTEVATIDQADEMPAWAARSLAKTEAEIATYKRRIAEVEAETASYWTPARIQEQVERELMPLIDERHSLWREIAGRRADLEKKHFRRISGTTREELIADALQLAEITA